MFWGGGRQTGRKLDWKLSVRICLTDLGARKQVVGWEGDINKREIIKEELFM